MATGILSEGQIAPAIRDVLRNYQQLRVVLGEVEHIDVTPRDVHVDEFGKPAHRRLRQPDRRRRRRDAPTSATTSSAQCACGMKSLDDALALRGEIFGAFELAEAEADPAARRRLMTFVVVGGGPTGVEMAGQLKELSPAPLRRNYRRIDPHDTRVVLVEGTDRLLGSMGRRLSRLTARNLARMGVELHLGAMVTGMDDDGVEITSVRRRDRADPGRHQDLGRRARAPPASGRRWPTRPAPSSTRRAGCGSRPTAPLPGHPEVFVVGDLMALDDLPGVAEVAMQSGAHAAHTHRPAPRGQAEPSPSATATSGRWPSISRFRAVAKIGPLQVGGFIGWLLWLVVHLTFLTGFKNRFGALARWAVSFVGRGRYERALTGRWVARAERPANLPKVPSRHTHATSGETNADQRDAHRRAERPHQRHPAPHGPHRQRDDPAQRVPALARRRGAASPTSERAEAKALRTEIQDEVKAEGLWAPHLPPEYGGMGIDFMAHAYMNEILAYAVGAASLFGVVAPNSGNQTILVKYGTEEQKQKWLLPLVEGTMQSGFSMTEPENAGLRPALDPDHRHPRGRRVGHQRAQVVHLQRPGGRLLHRHVPGQGVQGRREPGPHGPDHRADLDAGRDHRARHRDLGRAGVRTTARCATTTCGSRSTTLLGQVGDGHRAAQDRLGAGRIFHCMNSVGQMWRAFDLMVERLLTREVHGGLLKDKQFMQGFVADSYMDLQSARLMTIHAAEKVDAGRPPGPHRDQRHQGLRARPPTAGSSTGPSRSGAPPASRATCRWPRCTSAPARCAWPTAPTRCTASSSPRTSCTTTRRARAGTSPDDGRAVTWQPGPAVSVFAAGLFEGQVAVVTGGGTGLGREVAHAFARLGGHAVIAGRTAARLDEVAASIEAAGGGCTAVPTNIREPDQVDALRDAVYERFGRVDFLVNNAGGQFPALPSAISDNGWRAVVDLNLNGTWNMTNRFMAPMAEAGSGAIVNVVHTFSFDAARRCSSTRAPPGPAWSTWSRPWRPT